MWQITKHQPVRTWISILGSSPSKPPRALFIGRWQPFHTGHEWLIDQKLGAGVPVLIAVRDVAPDPNNPLAADQVAALIRKRYAGLDVAVLVIPDIESVNVGRRVGYAVETHTPPGDVGGVSGTEIRRQVRAGVQAWQRYVDRRLWADVAASYGGNQQGGVNGEQDEL